MNLKRYTIFQKYVDSYVVLFQTASAMLRAQNLNSWAGSYAC